RRRGALRRLRFLDRLRREPYAMPDPELDGVDLAFARSRLARLTPREREVFVLVELEGASAAAAATALGIAASTVRVLHARARNRLTGTGVGSTTGRRGAR